MLKIGKINKTRLHNGEHFEIMSQFRNQVREEGAETLKIVEPFTVFTELWSKEDAVLKKMRKSLITEEVVKLDHKRDAVYRSLQLQVDSFLVHFNTAKQAAAKTISAYLKNYGSPVERSYNEETSDIYNLVADLKTKCAAELTLLNLNEWVTELDKANKEFNNTYIARSADDAEKDLHTNMKEVRTEIDEMYDKIVYMLNAFVVVYDEPVFTKFIEVWNKILEKYRLLLARRVGNNKEEELEEQ